MDRAYSVFQLKSVDDELRVVSGVASTPTPDHDGDIVESEGAEFSLPLPLLWQHDRHSPIGHVTHAVARSDGIHITAQLAPAGVLPRIDECWQLLKHRLVGGLSIGFRALRDHVEPIKETGGFRIKRWHWHELSCVTIPANSQATISLIKSLDSDARAATGPEPPVVAPTSAGVSAPVVRARSARAMTKTVQEQIKDFEATRAAKSAQMVAIMEKSGSEGTTLDDAKEGQEYDELQGEVTAIDKHLKRLADLETMQKARAIPAAGNGAEAASASRAGTNYPVITVSSTSPPGYDFARIVLCKAASFLALQSGDPKPAYAFAQERYPDNARVKAALAPATTTGTTWAAPLVYAETLASEFIEFLRPQTLVGRLALRRVPFNVRIVGQSSGGSAYWVGEAKPKPLTKFDFTAVTLGFAKVAAISVISDELARFSSPSAETLVRDGLARAVTERIDIDFIDPTQAAVANVSPASITNGVTPLSPSGTNADAVRTDLANMLQVWLDNNQSATNAALIMPASLAMVVGMMRNALGQTEFPGFGVGGGTLEGITVVTTQYAANTSGAGNLVILVNQSEIFLADDGQVTVDVSRESSLEMNDAPTQNPPTGASLVSLWQNNLLGLRAERQINWAKARSTSVVYMDDVNWGGIGSPA